MQKAQEELNFAYQKKKGINAERKEARMEKEEADRYARFKEDLVRNTQYTIFSHIKIFTLLQNDKLVEHQLFRLFYNEREMKIYEQDLKSKQREVEKIERKKEKAEEVLKEKRKEQGKVSRELAKIEQDIREVVSPSVLLT